MCVEENILRNEERVGFALRGLYGSYGYSRFKMGKFEEYELYVRNKDFLVGERMITFTDGDGRLLALKPDVTISIIKNTQEGDRGLRKVYYNESVYRPGKGENAFREVVQTGLECIGSLDSYQIFEVIFLAVKSLETISPDYMLDISHMGLVSGLMKSAGVPEEDYTRVLSCVREKNPTELAAYSREKGLSNRDCALLKLLIDIYGDMKTMLDLVEPYCTEPEAKKAISQLRMVDTLLREAKLCDRVRIDFSVAGDMNYYNGIVFRGYIKGLPDGILSGGQYDRLVQKMGKDFGAIGFAITLNELERLKNSQKDFDVDVLILYNEESNFSEVTKLSERLVAQGKQVSVQSVADGAIRALETLDLRGGEKDA